MKRLALLLALVVKTAAVDIVTFTWRNTHFAMAGVDTELAESARSGGKTLPAH